MKVVTRFAPSPTGTLHLGSARTALFNYLFAKHYGGKFLLRIEDTDAGRSKQEHTNQLLEALDWLMLNPDDEIIYQSSRYERHREMAKQLVDAGYAYYCYYSMEDLQYQRQQAKDRGENFVFRSPYRDKTTEEVSGQELSETTPVIRLKVPENMEIALEDLVQGKVTVNTNEVDDLVLVRSDGSPTYNLAVVVDDHDMDITHIIRGDDHLNNSFKQVLIYKALGFELPDLAHIPLIHNQQGEKLSKREGASDVLKYKRLGYLSEAMNNYLLRLGWSHENEEIIDRARAEKLFSSHGLGKSPAKLDYDKLDYLNAHYIHHLEDSDFMYRLKPFLEADPKIREGHYNLDKQFLDNVAEAAPSIKKRVATLAQGAELSLIYHPEFWPSLPEEAKAILENADEELLARAKNMLRDLENFDKDSIQSSLKAFAAEENMKVGALMKPIRVIMTGMVNSPSIFELMAIIGKDKTMMRLNRYV
jgi:glutamyl-tRNA synthetase